MRLRTMLMTLAALGLLATPRPASAKPRVTMKIATLAPEGSTWMNLMHELDDRVREDTGEEAGFRFYPGGVQGDEKLVLRKMRSGQLHGGGFTGNGLGVIAPELRVLEAPFLFTDEGELDAVHDAFDEEFSALVESRGYVLLGWAEVGFVHVFTREPVRRLADFRDVRMWLWEGDPLPELFFREAGITPVPLPITDVYTSLQTGLIDGVYCSPYACVVLQWHTRVGAMSATPISHAIGAVVVTRKQFEKISAESREKIRGIASDIFTRLKSASRDENRRAVEDIRAAGITVVQADEDAVEEFLAIGARSADLGTASLFPAELLGRVRARILAHREAASAPEE
ncbi:MAG: TRAP transporter substrate-binding protein DctP [Gemmatimonadota bacterium]|nr:TRAP transporter substrate-binding protein DctP [Gemmatimonadota bacterium]MDP6802973.1 TRAP transporter substrate-binding protein DctP [Gemmatimonadota bacterium]